MNFIEKVKELFTLYHTRSQYIKIWTAAMLYSNYLDNSIHQCYGYAGSISWCRLQLTNADIIVCHNFLTNFTKHHGSLHRLLIQIRHRSINNIT